MKLDNQVIDNLVFKRKLGGFFKIDNCVLSAMNRFRQDLPNKPESGGVMLGRHILGTKNIVVDQISTPVVEDLQSRNHFFRSKDYHQQVIDNAWRESEGTRTYLGEWHTHPERFPSPSVVDQCDWRRKLIFDQFSDYCFFVIVGTTEIRVWEGRMRSVRLFKLEVVN